MFVHDFLRSWIRGNMQDPAERDRLSNEYLQKQREIAARMKRSWAQPTKPYGFWTSGEANAKHLINQDPGVQKLVGRKPAMDV